MSLLSRIHYVTIFIVLQSCTVGTAQVSGLIPTNTATHTAVMDGSWFDVDTWDKGTIPGDAAIVVIPMGINVHYAGCSDAHLFAIQVNGQFTCTPEASSGRSCLRFDTFIGGHMSYVRIHADNPLERIDITIDPFDIEAHKKGSSGYDQAWNTEAMQHFSDGTPVYSVTREVIGDRRYNTIEEALQGDNEIMEMSRELYDDGPGVTGRYLWDAEQHSLGFITMGQIEIIGAPKKGMVKLSQDALSNDTEIQLTDLPEGWLPNDQIVISRDGLFDNGTQAEDYVTISSINDKTITLNEELSYNHQGVVEDSLHCYVGNLRRNITFRSAVKDQHHQRGHIMTMHQNENLQVRNAAFIDLGRTDKSRVIDDVIWDRWIAPKVFKSKISPLGQEVCQMKNLQIDEVTNTRGRYSIHLHKTGAKHTDNIVYVTGNVVLGNPGWGITHHDSYADVSDNVVVDVVGAGIVSESGSELGFWDNNLVIDIKQGHKLNPYDAAVFHDDLLYSGQGLGMKGRGVLCRGNVVVAAEQGVGVLNLNPSVSNHDRVDPLALAQTRPGFEFDQFPLSHNGYSIEGDGVMPVEVPLKMENTLVIDVQQGLRSIERDMGLNHESRSIFDGYVVWGAKQGLSINYQADYSFKDVYISGFGNNAIGVVMWKHSHNQTYENIKLVDLDYGIQVSQLAESGNGLLKTRNNGFTPWLFVDLVTENVDELYLIQNEDEDSEIDYTEHADNTIVLTANDISPRPTTFTILDSSQMIVDYATDDFRFEIDGIITDDFGSYHMGTEQAVAQGELRLDYPSRIYEFASKEKFEEYLIENGVYRDLDSGQLFFIVTEWLPNRRTFEYQDFPIRIEIRNAPASSLFDDAIETAQSADAPLQLISRLATASQSSTAADVRYQDAEIVPAAWKAIDGNDNGRINCQIYQRDLLPVGSFAQTESELEPWFELDLQSRHHIDYIDIWNTVDLQGPDVETPSPHFESVYVLISETAFGDAGLAEARSIASYEYLIDASQRKYSINDINTKGRYIRVQAVGNAKIKMAEIEVIGQRVKTSTAVMTESSQHFSIYPNPSRGTFSIKSDDAFRSESIKVYSILGNLLDHRQVLNHTLSSLHFNLRPGSYLILLESTEGKQLVEKLIITE